MAKRGRPRINPTSLEEWQEAVNMAWEALCIDSLFQYGLLVVKDAKGKKQTASGIKVDRCERILSRGKKLGIIPVIESNE